VTITPTPITAAAAGVFSALIWPWLWSTYGGPATGGGVELVLGTLLLIGLPAHALVVGFKPAEQVPGSRGVDKALLTRIAAWLLAAVVAALVSGALHG
jgi:hypothetical protein